MTTPTASSEPAALLYSDAARELATTRRVLERVPDGQSDWRPHEKSMTLGRLATHLAELPATAGVILGSDERDIAATGYTPRVLQTTVERLALFDENAAAMQQAIAAADWPAVERTWTLRAGDRILARGPKSALLRTIVLSHMIHHRAQLGVYLRLLGVPVPSVYGPSADEQ